MKEQEQRMFTLLHDVAYMLALQADGMINTKQFEEWRDRWLQEMGRFMIEMLAEQEEKEKGEKNGEDSRTKE